MQYSDFQNLASSEKIVLAIMEVSKRLVGWSHHVDDVYKIEGFDVPAIVSLSDSGINYAECSNLGEIGSSRFYYDRANKTIYIQTSEDGNPNGRFLSVVFKFCFSNVPVVLPHDLSSGYEVQFEPMISETSRFGVEMDTINQAGEAIEGRGVLTLWNDGVIWPEIFDNLIFENQNCYIYSYNRNLVPSDAKLLFKGKIESKSYQLDKVSFQINDMLLELRNVVPLGSLGDLGLRTNVNISRAKERMIFGKVFGHRPSNLDEVLSGYPLIGTVSIVSGTDSVVGIDTEFLRQLSPDDRIILNGVAYTVATVISDSMATLTEIYSPTFDLSDSSTVVVPSFPKRYINRVWSVCGHSVRQPTTTTLSGSTVTDLYVGSTVDISTGDVIYIGELGEGELATVSRVVNQHLLRLSTSLQSVPGEGITVTRPGIQNVKIDDIPLVYYRDYTFDATLGRLLLRDTAEANASPIRQMSGDLSFTSGSRVVTGAGLDSIIKPGYMVGCVGQAEFFEVLSVDSETEMTIRTPSTYTHTDKGRYKYLIFDSSENVLTCDSYGRTDDATTSGGLIKTAPRVVQTLLMDMGMSEEIDTESFDSANDLVYEEIGFVIPEKFSDTNSSTYRDIINKVNKSVLSSLVQTDSFKLTYCPIHPDKSASTLKLGVSDILSLSANSTTKNMVRTAIVEYQTREYDYSTRADSIKVKQNMSDTASYILKTDRERTFRTCLIDEEDAQRLANRWSMILEQSAGEVKILTKLQSVSLEVGDIIDITHPKLFKRFSGLDRRRILLVESIKKSGKDVEIEAVDLSGLFNRCGSWSSAGQEWSDLNSDERIYSGYWMDEYGLIDNDSDSFGQSLWW